MFFFDRAKDVEAAIRAKDLGPALRWCDDNASRLRKLESTLEFRVRERDFLEMVRANKRVEVWDYVCGGAREECVSGVGGKGIGSSLCLCVLHYCSVSTAHGKRYSAVSSLLLFLVSVRMCVCSLPWPLNAWVTLMLPTAVSHVSR